MPNEINQTTIINRALQLLGHRPVANIQSNDRGARAMNTAYKPVLYSMLEENYWAFSIKRSQVAKDTIAPVHTKKNRFKLPGDFIMLAPDDQVGNYPTTNDWIVEGGYIVSDDAEPIYIRYVSNSVTEDQFPALFAEAFSAQLAVATCEEITQSNSKLNNVAGIYDRQINLAKKRNFILIQKPRAPISPWISGRL